MAAPKTQAPEKPKYEMPAPPLGLVNWHHTPGCAPSPAIVTNIGRNAINVLVIPPDSRVGIPKDGVIHVTDPRTKGGVNPDTGCWDFSEETKRLIAVEALLNSLTK